MGIALQGPLFALTTADRILQEGDSISALDTYTQMPMRIKRSLLVRAQATLGGPQPFWVNTAVSSTGVVASLSRIQTAMLKYPFTKLFAVYGTADWILGTALGTFTTNFNAILDLVCGNGIPAYIVGPTCVGEKWPTGQNATDALGDSYIAAMSAGQQRYPGLCTFRDMRAAMYSIQEPLRNLPAPGITVGPATRPDALGAHFNAGGRGLCDVIISGDIVVQDGAFNVPTSNIIIPNQSSLGLDYDANALLGSDGNPGITDASNVTTWVTRGMLPQATWNLTITPGTKPVYRQIAAAGKINNLPAVQAAGNTSMQSTALAAPAIAQPMISAIVFNPTNFGANQIMVDSTPATSVNLPYLTTALVQPNFGTVMNPTPPQSLVAGKWAAQIFVSNGAAQSYSVLNGAQSALAPAGTNPRDRVFMFASATGGILPMAGMIARFMEWHSILGALPTWQQVYGYLTAKYGQMPQ